MVNKMTKPLTLALLALALAGCATKQDKIDELFRDKYPEHYEAD